MIGPAGTFAAPKAPEKKWEHDIYVQCTRCRNKHMESDRVETAPDKYGLRTMACPRCGGHNYYKLDDNGKRCR
jgi:predicted nucleic-acid-binding Zn-ribbon protein